MKTIYLRSLGIAIFLITMIALSLPAQPPPPPPPGGHGQNGNQKPSDVPIGGGVEILIALGAIYTGLVTRRIVKAKNAQSA